MRITAYNGSPDGRKSVTNKMVQEILAGAAEAGAKTQNYFLAEKNISHCRACSHCLSVELNKCIIQDDMEEMLKSFKQSDIVIYATPLYFDNVSGMMKMFFDRSLSLVAPYVGLDENGEYRHIDKPGFSDSFSKVPKLVAVSNAAFPEQSQFQVISHLFKRMARNIHTQVIAEIYRGEGPLLRDMVPQLSPIVEGYKKLLREAGREIVETMKLSEETKAKLEKALIPHEAYVKGWNASIDNDWDRSDM
ncbi:MAG: flavodoxin family protein [Bacillota bacterium]|nr:flavodoxin family protein [Bacillota bacterium]